MFEASEIVVTRGCRSILHGVSLNVSPGEIVGLIGSNGAGKSTLLKSMCGESHDSGSVTLDGIDIRRWASKDLAKRRGVLSQHSELNFPLTAHEVVMLGRNPHIIAGESRADRAIADEALATVDAGHLAEQVYPTLSGGERQRVQLARVLAQIWDDFLSRYLFLDEPTASLDILHQHMTLDIVRSMSRRNTGVLVVLHDLTLAATYCDRLYLMKDGLMVANGKPHQLLTRDAISEVFNLHGSGYQLPVDTMMRQIESLRAGNTEAAFAAGT